MRNVPYSWMSRSSRLSNLVSFSAGFKSNASSTWHFLRNSSTTNRLNVSTIGPDIPNSVNINSPNSSRIFLPSTHTTALTLRRLRPCKRDAESPAVSSGTNACRGVSIPCPAAAANR